MTDIEKLDMAIEYIRNEITDLFNDLSFAKEVNIDGRGKDDIEVAENNLKALTYAVKVLEKARSDHER